MYLETLRNHLLAKPGTSEGLPFGPQALVFKVLDKMFAIIALDETPPWVTLKCDPDRALLLRDRYDAVRPGYHTNKKHWNTIVLNGTVPDPELLDLADHSYDLVVSGMKKADRALLEEPQPNRP